MDATREKIVMEEQKENCIERVEEPLGEKKLSEIKDRKNNKEEGIKKEDDPYAYLGFKSKVMLTFVCFGLYSATAFETSMLGPCLVDLEMRLNTSTETISYMFTLQGSMSLVTSLFIGPVFDRIDGFLLVSLGGFISALFLSVSLWYKNLISFLCLLTPTGIQAVLVSIGCNSAVIEIWKERSAPYLQSLNCVYSVTLAIGPLIVQPFLIDTDPATGVKGTDGRVYNSSPMYDQKTQDVLFHGLRQPIQDNATTPSILPTPSKETKVQYVFLLSGMYHLFWSVCMLVAFFVYFGKIKKSKISKKNVDTQPIDRTFFHCTCILFFFFMFCYSVLELCYPWYLMTFVVKYLGWSKILGIYVTLSFQMANIVATFSCIFLIRFVQPSKLVLLGIFICITSMGVLSFTAYVSDTMVWICSIGLGLGYSTMVPSSYAWVSSKMAIRGTFSAIYWCGYFVGQVCVPPLIGYLFEEVEPMSFIYILLSCSILLLVFYVLFSLLIRYFNMNENLVVTQQDIQITDSSKLNNLESNTSM